MSSVHRQPGRKNWFCAFYDENGRRRFKSTKTPDKRAATAICRAWDLAARKAREGTLTVERARGIVESVVVEIAERVGLEMPHTTVEAFLTTWLRECELNLAEHSFMSYRTAVVAFLRFLGNRKKMSLSSLGKNELQGFKEASLRGRIAPSTANLYLRIIRNALNAAVRQDLITTNPAAKLAPVRAGSKGSQGRRPFTLDELHRAMDVANDEWRGMILIGVYCGLRLSDAANLTWHNIDLARGELTLATAKTGRTVNIPLARSLLTHLERLPTPDDPGAPIFPGLEGKRVQTLSEQFYEVLVAAGLASKRVRGAKDADGLPMKRKASPLTFHSLRHTATSLLKNAGVSDVVARDIIGHESAAVSRTYTHVDTETKRAAIDRLPEL